MAAALSFALTAGAVCAARAETYPARAITIIVPYSAGGGTDVMARLIADELSKMWSQPVIVDNRPGASGNIGAERVAHANPDGYTLLITAGAIAIAPSLYAHLAYDPLKDFAPITKLADVPLLVVTNSGSPLKTMADLIEMAKKPGSNVTYATFGSQSPSSMAGASIAKLAGISMTEIPFKGSQNALPDILAGRTTIGLLDAVSTTPMVKDGRLRALAITEPKRAPALPDVPTLVESGIPFDTVGWHAAFAPANTPPAIVEKLNAAINKILAYPRLRETIEKNGSVPIEPAPTSAEWTKQFQADVAVWQNIVQSLHIQKIDF